MHKRIPRVFLIVGCIVFTSFPLIACAQEEGDKPAKEAPEPEKWSIYLRGTVDTPRRSERDGLSVSLAQDGAMTIRVYDASQRHNRTAFDGKISAEDTERFHSAARKIIDEYDPKNKNGNWGDGWDFNLSLSTGQGYGITDIFHPVKSSLRTNTYRSVEFRSHRSLASFARGAREIAEIIERNAKLGEFGH